MANRRRKKRKAGKVGFVLLTLFLIGMTTAAMCLGAFVLYLNLVIKPEADLDINGLSMKFNSVIYYNDDDGQQQTLQKLASQENREWVGKDDIPEYLSKAFVSIEDQRFYEHKGVDWKRTFGAAVHWILPGGNSYGGSTITPQPVKNMTEDNDYSVKRKVTEIMRALTLEKKVDDKDTILELYMNIIYFGKNAYGVQTASKTYFNKPVDQLDLAECALIAGLTQNPAAYNPFKYPDAAKERQKAVLYKMYEQGYISKSEYDQAVNEQLQYHENTEAQQQKKAYSYFTDMVITDVVNDLQSQLGYSETYARSLVTSGGLSIYATVDKDVQDTMESVFENSSNFPSISEDGVKPQAAMMVVDPKTGHILGVVGGRGEKTESLVLNRATQSKRSPGSSLKPLATYGPAMDAGIATPDTTVYDRALIQDAEGNPWPMNDGKYPTGRAMTVKEGMTRSLNTISAQLLKQLTPQKSYEFMTQQLGFKLVDSRTNEDGTVQSDIDLAPLALGALTDGVTVREMAGGFSTFINDGVYGGTRTYTKVTDSEGNTIMENTPNTDKGFTNVRTDYYMLDCLQNVTAHGTAYGIQLDGVETGGKTGTTTSNTDIWFCGITPKYSGAVWVGYEHNYRLDGLYGRNAAEIWLAVMQKVHAGDSGLVFDSHPQDFEEVTYCMDTGLLASGACRAAGRAATGRFWKDKVPTETCSHQNIENKYDFESMGVDNYYYDDEEDDSDSDSSSSDTDTGNEDSGDGGSYDSGDSGDSGGDSGDSGDSSEDPEA